MKGEADSSPSIERVPGPLGPVLSPAFLGRFAGGTQDVHHGRLTHDRADGMSDRWHYHPEIELTHFSEGEGIRLVEDSVRQVRARDGAAGGAGGGHDDGGGSRE